MGFLQSQDIISHIASLVDPNRICPVILSAWWERWENLGVVKSTKNSVILTEFMGKTGMISLEDHEILP